MTVVVETSANLGSGGWLPLQTNAISTDRRICLIQRIAQVASHLWPPFLLCSGFSGGAFRALSPLAVTDSIPILEAIFGPMQNAVKSCGGSQLECPCRQKHVPVKWSKQGGDS